MVKKIFIIGESQVAYMSKGAVHKGPPKALEYGSYKREKNNYDLFFLWQHSRTAFKIDGDYLENLFKNNINDLGADTVIVSEFGGMDAALGQYQKHNNMSQIMTKYSSEMINFANKYNTKLIFMAPWWQVDDDNAYQVWHDITDLLVEISKKNNLPKPIEIMYNILERKYPVIDEWKHHTPEDSERIVDYVILKVDEIYGS